MARSATKLRAIAWTAFQETLRRRVFYIVLVLVGLVGFLLVSQMVFVNMASAASETKLAGELRVQACGEALQTWNLAATFLALFLGAVGVSSEISAKTIANVFSRPVEHWLYLLGRALGTLAFLWSFQIVGLALGFVVVHLLGIQYSPLVWLGVLEYFVTSFFFCLVSLGSSVVMPPILAGIFAFLLSVAPALVSSATQHPHWINRIAAKTIYYLGPAQMPVNLVSEGLSKELLHPAYSLYFQVLLENALYAVAFFVVASILFSRKELKLR